MLHLKASYRKSTPLHTQCPIPLLHTPLGAPSAQTADVSEPVYHACNDSNATCTCCAMPCMHELWMVCEVWWSASCASTIYTACNRTLSLLPLHHTNTSRYFHTHTYNTYV